MKLRIASLPILCLALAVVPALAQPPPFWYDNGPINGNVNAYPISFGSMVSDSFFMTGWNGARNFRFGVWESPGDVMTSLQWSISSGYLGSGTVYGQGTANVVDQYLAHNQYGYNIDLIYVSTPSVPLPYYYRSYVLNLWNATTRSGNPVYWDENSGIGCMSLGCPSSAQGFFPDFEGPETSVTVGPIPSEAFTIDFFNCADQKGASGGCALEPSGAPEPGSIILFGSGILGLVGVLRRKLFL
jgi:PEP-CTERM motif-containing protein